jgi:hypothetical protein
MEMHSTIEAITISTNIILMTNIEDLLLSSAAKTILILSHYNNLRVEFWNRYYCICYEEIKP